MRKYFFGTALMLALIGSAVKGWRGNTQGAILDQLCAITVLMMWRLISQPGKDGE